MSDVRVLVIDCTLTGASPPTFTAPTRTGLDFSSFNHFYVLFAGNAVFHPRQMHYFVNSFIMSL